MEDSNLWGKIVKASVNLPLVHVDREEFLRKELSTYYKDPAVVDAAINGCIWDHVDKRVIDRLANGCIGYHTTVVTSVSALAGLPGGWAMAAAIPADIAQFYGHVFCLTQKIMYLYGMPSLADANGQINDEAADILTLFTGVMMGCQAAEAGLKDLLAYMAKGIVTDVAVRKLGNTALYQVARNVAAYIGKELTEKQFARGLGKVIPLIGAPISGSITYFTFKPMAKKLKKMMDEQHELRGQI